MRGFKDPLILKSYHRNQRAEWVVVDPFRYETPQGDTITVAPGAITDLASVPGGGFIFFKRDSLGLRYPSQPHDWLFTLSRLHAAYPDIYGDCPEWLSFSYANQVFRWCLEDNPYSGKIRTSLAHRAVQVGGWRTWGKGAKELVAVQHETLSHYGFDVAAYRVWAHEEMLGAGTT